MHLIPVCPGFMFDTEKPAAPAESLVSVTLPELQLLPALRVDEVKAAEDPCTIISPASRTPTGAELMDKIRRVRLLGTRMMGILHW